ncbi:unnamed protein product [Agarophyton chilense]
MNVDKTGSIVLVTAITDDDTAVLLKLTPVVVDAKAVESLRAEIFGTVSSSQEALQVTTNMEVMWSPKLMVKYVAVFRNFCRGLVSHEYVHVAPGILVGRMQALFLRSMLSVFRNAARAHASSQRPQYGLIRVIQLL